MSFSRCENEFMNAGVDASTTSDLVTYRLTACSSGRKVSYLNLRLCWRLFFILFTVTILHQPCECRYLPTRSQVNDLDKLRELMLQILEASAEMSATPQQQQQQQRQESEWLAGSDLGRRANWLNLMGGMNAAEAARKYNAPHSLYNNNGRYY